MTIDGTVYEFFDLPSVKDYLKIKETDDTDDKLLRNTIGPSADRYVKNSLIGYADDFPLEDELQRLAEGAAYKKAIEIYKATNNNFDGAEVWKNLAAEDILTLQNSFKARHAGRTRIVVASQSYDTEDESLFSQTIK